jgi:hypothetical protein
MEERGMQIEVPDGAYVHVSIGHAPMPLLPAPLLAAPAPGGVAPFKRRRLLTSMAGLLVLFGGYEIGRLTGPRGADLQAAQAAPATLSAATAALREQHAFPDRPLPRIPAPATDPGQVPAAFTDQLRVAPTVQPPPGQPPSGSGGANPFGLHP